MHTSHMRRSPAQVLSEAYDLAGIGPGADIQADSGPERPWERGTWQHGTLRPEDALLLSTACKMRYGDVMGAVADGWLCVADARLTFTPFEVLARNWTARDRMQLRNTLALLSLRSA